MRIAFTVHWWLFAAYLVVGLLLLVPLNLWADRQVSGQTTWERIRSDWRRYPHGRFLWAFVRAVVVQTVLWPVALWEVAR